MVPVRAAKGINPGSNEPFSPGLRHEPGLKGGVPFSLGSCLKPRLKDPFSNSIPPPSRGSPFQFCKKLKKMIKMSKIKILPDVVMLLHVLVRKI